MEALTFKLENKRPVEVADLANSLLGLADEYQRLLQREELKLPESTIVNQDDLRLCVTELRSGSVIAELQGIAPFTLPLVQNANSIFEFITYLKTAYDFLLGRTTTKPPLERVNYENLAKIVEPVAKDNGAQMNIGVLNINAPIYLTFDSMEANAAQNAAKRAIAETDAVRTGFHEKVLLYFFQARNDPKSKTGDKAVIESISPSPVKAVFLNEGVKARLLAASENLFNLAYVVDVAVETLRGRPALYRILRIYDSVERP